LAVDVDDAANWGLLVTNLGPEAGMNATDWDGKDVGGALLERIEQC
jgi:hypothetical protein